MNFKDMEIGYYYRPSDRGDKRLYYISDVTCHPDLGNDLLVITRWTSKGKEYIDAHPDEPRWERKVEVVNGNDECEWARTMESTPHYGFHCEGNDDRVIDVSLLNDSDADMLYRMFWLMLTDKVASEE
jgi:hypothetical protein